jgi:hypothetical protein
MPLDVYAGGVHPDEKKRLAALVRGEEWSPIGQSAVLNGVKEFERFAERWITLGERSRG